MGISCCSELTTTQCDCVNFLLYQHQVMFVLNITFPRRKTGEFSREEAQSETSWFECELDMREPANFGKVQLALEMTAGLFTI